jgi:hypothetical protein
MAVGGAKVFRSYSEQVLGPTLASEEIVRMDHLAVHKVAEIAEAIQPRTS